MAVDWCHGVWAEVRVARMPCVSRGAASREHRGFRGGDYALFLYGGCLAIGVGLLAVEDDVMADCSNCHQGIEAIAGGEMAQRIAMIGRRHRDPDGCVVCHGGDPTAESKQDAHRGAPPQLIAAGGPAAFYPDPGDAWIAHLTCGQCHEGYAERWRKSVMSTGAEAIDRNQCAVAREKKGLRGDVLLRFGRYPVLDGDGPEPVVGTPAYKFTTRLLIEQRPADYSASLLGLPGASAERFARDAPAYCYSCHGRDASARSSCSLCHMASPAYQGLDPAIDGTKPKAMKRHRILGTGTARSTDVDDTEAWLPGIPLQTCFQCHYDPRLAGVNAIGDAHVHYGGEHGARGGHLLCQDCHTSIEMHGDGNIPLRSEAQIEIRCEDCHGTTKYLPWELPLNFGDPEQPEGLSVEPRGLSAEGGDPVVGPVQSKEGFLLTSKGNPFGNVVRVGSEVRLYSASGAVHKVTLLKSLTESRSWRSELSMQVKTTDEHEAMTCRDCHADWLPPCLGCHEQDRGEAPRSSHR